MSWDDGLIGPSRDIASSEDKLIRVMAGPGTGKSYALRKRVQKLLEEGVQPDKILAVTFTRNAAQDFKCELSKIQVEGAEQINSTTLHSFSFKMLTSNSVFEFNNRKPRLLLGNSKIKDKFEFAPLVYDLIELIPKEYNYKITKTLKKLKEFEASWATLQHHVPGWPENEIDRVFNRLITEWLTFHEAMIIGEVISLYIDYLRDNPEGNTFNSNYYILVDEYQDLNKAEQSLIDRLAKDSNLIIVGDSDQSIYSFKFAHPEGIAQFSLNHQNTVDIPLNTCRRCPKFVVEMANKLIQYNRLNPNTPVLLSDQSNVEGEVSIIQWSDFEDEADGISIYCEYLIQQKEIDPKDILILVPRKRNGVLIGNKLHERNILSQGYFTNDIFSNTEFQVSIAKLSLLVNIEDRVSLRFLLGFGNANYRSNKYRHLKELCIKNNLSPWQALLKIKNEELVDKQVTKHLLPIFNILLEELNTLRVMEPFAVFDRLFPNDSDWSFDLRKVIKPEEVNSIPEIFNSIIKYTNQTDPSESSPYVKIMTIHKSKGLSSKVVIICSCNQGILPSEEDKEANQEKHLQEQRRLFYVALTRTKEILVLSYISRISYADSSNLKINSFKGRAQASQFIKELGPTAPERSKGSDWLSTLLPKDKS